MSSYVYVFFFQKTFYYETLQTQPEVESTVNPMYPSPSLINNQHFAIYVYVLIIMITRYPQEESSCAIFLNRSKIP